MAWYYILTGRVVFTRGAGLEIVQKTVLIWFVDTSFGGYFEDSISSTEAIVCSVEPNTYVPVQWLRKRQTVASHSQTLAEVICLDTGGCLNCIPVSYSGS